MESDAIAWLQQWFRKQCDGKWEHTYGVQIETVDNPGWSITIDLCGTELQNATMPPLVEDRGADDWVRAEVKDRRFIGHGDPDKLTALANVFRAWVTSHERLHGSGRP
jgi:hypothetical protein